MAPVSKQLKRKNTPESRIEDDESDFDTIEKEFSDSDEDEYEDGEDEDDDENEEDAKEIEAHKDAELEELEKEIATLRGEQDILMNLKRHTDDELLKGQAVKNQKALWDKTLELRFLLQKVFSSSNKLPQDPTRTSFCGSDEAVGKAYSDLITSSEKTLDCLAELEEALLEKNPSIVQVTDGSKNRVKDTDVSKKLDVGDDKEWSRIQKLHSRVAPFRDSSIDKWQRKSQVTTGVAGFKGKLQAFSQNISEQVATYMRDPSKMIKRMQLRRPVVGVFGAVIDASDSIKENALEDGDPELLDDSEFYQQLLKEFLESCNSTSSELTFYALKRQQTKKRKIVDRRASKSRKIRYHVHDKIVNFMAPEPSNLPDMAPVLFGNLFGLRHPRNASVA